MLERPLRTLTTLDRFGLVTWEGSEPMLRMLQVNELKSAMGFPGVRTAARQQTRPDQDDR
jgi:DNA (cytosine-5)-methyltransferase 1